MCLSFFQIKDLGQSRSKSAFSQKDTYLAFSFLFPRVLLSYQHHSKTKFRMYFAQPHFCIFEWCEPVSITCHYAVKKSQNLTFKVNFQSLEPFKFSLFSFKNICHSSSRNLQLTSQSLHGAQRYVLRLRWWRI